MTLGKVTVAVALCNNAEYVKRCIDSVIAQTYKDIEIIIVDDGSKDDSVKICGEYTGLNGISLIVKENGGLSSARQRALEAATGDYICFIDADDYLEKTYVEHLLRKLVSEAADVCICSTLFLDSDGNKLVKESAAYHSAERASCNIGNDDLNQYFDKYCAEYLLSDSWNKMYRMEFLRKSKVNFELPKGFNGTDLVFNYKLLLHKPQYCSIGSAEYNHIIYSKSATHRKKKRLQEGSMCITDQLINECNITNNQNIIEKILPSVYMRLMRKSFQDVYYELNTDKKELNKEFSVMVKKHREYLKRSHLKVNCFKIKSKALLVFAFALMYAPVLLKPYLYLRMKYSGSEA